MSDLPARDPNVFAFQRSESAERDSGKPPGIAQGHQMTPERYREATSLAITTSRYIADVHGRYNDKHTQTYARKELDKVWKNPDLARSLGAQGVTAKGMDDDLAAGRLDRIQAVLNKSGADVTKSRQNQVATEIDNSRAAGISVSKDRLAPVSESVTQTSRDAARANVSPVFHKEASRPALSVVRGIER